MKYLTTMSSQNSAFKKAKKALKKFIFLSIFIDKKSKKWYNNTCTKGVPIPKLKRLKKVADEREQK